MAGNDFERHKYNYTIPQDNLRQLKRLRQELAEREHGEELAWAAGVFEGEGCIRQTVVSSKTYKGRYSYPRLDMAMTDEDVVRRFKEAVGGIGSIHYVHTPSQKLAGKKPAWCWTASNIDARVVIEQIGPYLCERRAAKAAEVFSAPDGRVD